MLNLHTRSICLPIDTVEHIVNVLTASRQELAIHRAVARTLDIIGRSLDVSPQGYVEGPDILYELKRRLAELNKDMEESIKAGLEPS